MNEENKECSICYNFIVENPFKSNFCWCKALYHWECWDLYYSINLKCMICKIPDKNYRKIIYYEILLSDYKDIFTIFHKLLAYNDNENVNGIKLNANILIIRFRRIDLWEYLYLPYHEFMSEENKEVMIDIKDKLERNISRTKNKNTKIYQMIIDTISIIYKL